MNKRLGTLVTVIAGAAATPAPSDLPPTELEEVVAPIEDVELVIAESNPPQYMLNIVSGLPSGCAKFDEYDVVRDGAAIEVSVTNLRPAPGQTVACTAIYEHHEGTVNLSNDFGPDETYIVFVNGLSPDAFMGMYDRALGMAVKQSPIED